MSHWPQPAFQLTVVGFNPVVAVLLAVVPCRREQLVDQPWVHRCPVGDDLRRRLRRDLYDGLGPHLGAVTLRIETARNLTAVDPDRADALLEAATRDVASILTDVRRVVHDLRPPALDELGLLGAVRQQADRFAGTADGLDVQVTGDEAPADLPAAVEVA